MVIFPFNMLSFGVVFCIRSTHAIYSHMLILAGGVMQPPFQGWAVQAPPEWTKDHLKWTVWDAAILFWRAREVNDVDTDTHMWVGLTARELAQAPSTSRYRQSQR